MRRLLIACLTICALHWGVLTSTAAIYMKIDDIKGEVTADGFVDAIELYSLQFGMALPLTTTGGITEPGSPQLSDITVTKPMDISSTKLMTHLATAASEKTVTISLVKTGADKLFTYCQITLSNVFFSSFSISSGGDRPSESLSLHFSKIEVKYFVSDSTTPVDTFVYDSTVVK